MVATSASLRGRVYRHGDSRYFDDIVQEWHERCNRKLGPLPKDRGRWRGRTDEPDRSVPGIDNKPRAQRERSDLINKFLVVFWDYTKHPIITHDLINICDVFPEMRLNQVRQLLCMGPQCFHDQPTFCHFFFVWRLFKDFHRFCISRRFFLSAVMESQLCQQFGIANPQNICECELRVYFPVSKEIM